MKTTQTNRGITLIALVVTIIILIILAGVSINLLFGQYGIVNRASESKTMSEIGTEKEILQLSLTDIMLKNNGKLYFDEETLEKALKDNSGRDGITADKSGDSLYIVTFPESQRQYKVYSNGEIEEAAPKVTDATPGGFEGTGTSEDPYIITSVEDLVVLSNNVSPKYSEVSAGTQAELYNTYEGKWFKLNNDIDFTLTSSYVDATSTTYGDVNDDGQTKTLIEEMTSGAGFRPIGKYSYTFKGNIEGNNKTISGLYINNSNSNLYVGLIGQAENTTIKNLTLKDVNIKSTSYTAAFIGKMVAGDLIASNLHCSGTINSNDYTATILGYYSNNSIEGKVEITNCTNQANITSRSAGGFVGQVNRIATVKLDNCENNGNISGNNNAGGLISDAENANNFTINNCKNSGKISSASNAGGLVGYVTGTNIATIEKCFNEESVNATNSYAGGLVGTFMSMSSTGKTTINSCYNLKNVTATNFYVGGIVGRGDKNTTITNCFNKGDISGSGYTGGIIGSIENNGDKIIENVYNTGKVTSSNKNTTAGILGYSSSLVSVKKSYNTGNVFSGEGAAIIGDSHSRTLENNYYLKGSANIGSINEENQQGKIEILDTKQLVIQKMETDMVTPNSTIWKSSANNVNDGYPLLNF